MSLLSLSQQFSIYIGYSLLIAGLIGNGINANIFRKENTDRATPTTFYFLVGSISNIIFLTFSLVPQILNIGYGINIGITFPNWCKLRQYLLIVSNLTSLTCSCLAAIDQFFLTSRRQCLRRLSQIKSARRIVSVMIVIWCSINIPVWAFYNISSETQSCTITNWYFALFFSVFFFGVIFTASLAIMLLFGWLTYRNIQQTVALVDHNIDRQSIKMTFIQVGLVVVSFLPYGIYHIYELISARISKDPERLMVEYFISTIVNLIANLFSSVC